MTRRVEGTYEGTIRATAQRWVGGEGATLFTDEEVPSLFATVEAIYEQETGIRIIADTSSVVDTPHECSYEANGLRIIVTRTD